MKRLSCLLSFLLLMLMQVCAKDYVVTAQTLNVRSQPTTYSSVVGTLKKGDLIENVPHSFGEWLSITHNGTEGYINTKYISPVTGATDESIRKKQEMERYISDIETAKLRGRWLLGAIIICLIAMYFITKIQSCGWGLFLVYLCMYLPALLLILYFNFTPYSMWFICPSIAGWASAIGNFILFAFLSIMMGGICAESFTTFIDWNDLLMTIVMIIGGLAYLYGFYLCISAIFHQVPEALLIGVIIVGTIGRGISGGSSNRRGSLRDRYGRDMDGHFDNDNTFYGNDGNRYDRDHDDDSWHRS